MLTPVQWPLTLYPGATFDPLFTFYSDFGHAEPFDLTGYSAELVVGNGALVLSSTGAGLTLGGEAGTVQALATPAQTAELAPGQLPWFLQWTDTAGKVNYPASGTLTVTPP